MSPALSPALRTRRIALIGNPNTGKTTLFNALTGLKHRVGNYPGVTVEKKLGLLAPGLELIDLPGTYSLAAHSPDEMVAVQVLLGRFEREARPDLVVVIVDASNLARNLYLVTQILELGLPVVMALNMVDAAEGAGMDVDAAGLSEALGIPVVPTVAHQGRGLPELRQAIEAQIQAGAPRPAWTWPEPLRREIEALTERFGGEPFLLARALIDEQGSAEQALRARVGEEALPALEQARARIKEAGKTPAVLEAQMRYAWIGRTLKPQQQRRSAGPSVTDRLDALLTHRLLGTLFFVGLMTLVFMSIFVWAGPLMDGITALFDALGAGLRALFAGTALEGGMLQSLLVDGIVTGVQSVLVFLPQILILFFFLALLEDCGYMARAAFLMDRLLRFCGLSGHSFIPLMSSFACAVPGIMAARTIAQPRDRFTTILVAPLMSCSARIPVYVLMISAFVPAVTVGRFFNLQGLVFAAMYFVGILTAIPVAFLLKKTLFKGPTPPFILELPPYKRPNARTVLRRVFEAGRAFTLRAGTVIFVISVLVWALAYFPRSGAISGKYAARADEARQTLSGDALSARLAQLQALRAGENLRHSYFGRMGHLVEPLFRPLGWDWRISMAALASFPAREVIISTLGIIYDLGGNLDLGKEEERGQLAQRLHASAGPDGRKVFSLPVALSIMVFFALCCQCGATLATIKRETNTWRWPLFTFVYMTLLAYLGALLTYQAAIRFL